MTYSKPCEYAVRALAYLAQRGHGTVAPDQGRKAKPGLARRGSMPRRRLAPVWTGAR